MLKKTISINKIIEEMSEVSLTEQQLTDDLGCIFWVITRLFCLGGDG